MPPDPIIRSRQNPIYKQLRSLLRRDRRHQERAFLVEGPRFIADAMAMGAMPALMAFSESTKNAHGELALASIPHRVFDDDLFASLTDTVTSQGVLAAFPFPEFPSPIDREPLILVADGVQDPGNLGTLIRSAAGAGATQVIALTGTADPWGPKTVRAAAGAHFLIPIALMTPDELPLVIPDNALLVAADADGPALYDEYDLSGPLVVIIGAEGEGLSPGTLALDLALISIPLAPGVESLNAGAAGSILLFEASRQRRQRAKRTKT